MLDFTGDETNRMYFSALGLLDGNCYERISREISSSEAKDRKVREESIKDKAGALPEAVYTRQH